MLKKANYADVVGNTQKHKTKDDKLYSQSGAKYHGKRSGLASQLDVKINERNEQRMMDNYGAGFVNYRACDNDGNAILNPPPMNIDGRLHYANSAGYFRILDHDLIAKKAQVERERAEYVEKILEEAILSNDICMHILGITTIEMLEPKRSIRSFGLKGIMSEEMDSYDATPEYLNSFGNAVGNSFYAGGIAKLRKIIQSQMPIITGMTSAAVANAE